MIVIDQAALAETPLPDGGLVGLLGNGKAVVLDADEARRYRDDMMAELDRAVRTTREAAHQPPVGFARGGGRAERRRAARA